jgi:hypothetical protein
LKQGGLYTIVIEDYGVSDAGTYNISFLKVPGAANFPGDPDGGAIASGETLSGTINVPSDLDAFKFDGTAGDRVIINAVKTAGNLDTYIILYPPGGGPAEANSYQCCSYGGDTLDVQLKQGGLYTIVIEDYGVSDAGTYNISMTKIPSTLRTGLYNPSPSNGASICNSSGSFSWAAVAGATGYDLYFGTDVTEPLVKIGNNLSTPTMAFPALETGKKYYWHVVAHTSGGDIQGPYWWFSVIQCGNLPPAGSITINDGGTCTNTTSASLSLTATDPSGVPQMCISNTDTCSSWITYATSKSWTLTAGEGTKTVYAWFKDGVGNANTSPYSDTIILDTTAPTNGTLAATPGTAQVSLNWSGFSDALCGINNYKLVVSTGGYPNVSCTNGEVIYSGAGTSKIHTGLTNGTTYYYRVCAVDNAGNLSTGATAYATPGGACTPQVDLGAASGKRETSLQIPISLTNCAGSDISAISVDIGYDPLVVTPTGALIGPAGTAADKTVSTHLVSTGLYRVSVFKISNNNIIGNGVVAYVTFDILENAPLGTSTLSNTPSASDPIGNPVVVGGKDGSVNVTACMAGDCDCNGSVSIAEVQSCINMFLKKKAVEICVDLNIDGTVSIDEVVMCINNHLGIVPTGDVLNAEAMVSLQDEEGVMVAIQPSLRLGVDTGAYGDTVTVPLVLRNVSGYEVAAVATDITFDTDILENPTVVVGPAGSAADKDVVYNEGLPGVLTVGVLSISNNTAIGDGIVAYVSFDVKATAVYGETYLEQSASGSDPYGSPVPMSVNRGIVNVNAEVFSDVPESNGAYDYIYTMYNLDITGGYPDGTYRPSQNVTRGQMAAFIIRALFGEDFTYESTPHFNDVPESHGLFKYIQKMYEEGITTGYPDGTYRPSQNVTRGQMATFIIRPLLGEVFTYEDTPHFTDVPDTHGAFKYIQKMYEEGITTGYPDGTYRPSQNVTRGQMATFIIRGFMNVP